jgi:hypothetical protein
VGTLFRLLLILGILAGLGYGGLVIVAMTMTPEPREISVPVPPSRFNK